MRAGGRVGRARSKSSGRPVGKRECGQNYRKKRVQAGLWEGGDAGRAVGRQMAERLQLFEAGSLHQLPFRELFQAG